MTQNMHSIMTRISRQILNANRLQGIVSQICYCRGKHIYYMKTNIN